jgi:PRC-barrel domain
MANFDRFMIDPSVLRSRMHGRWNAAISGCNSHSGKNGQFLFGHAKCIPECNSAFATFRTRLSSQTPYGGTIMMNRRSRLSLLLAGGLVLPATQLAAAQQPRAASPAVQAGERPANDPSGRSDANGPANGQASGNQILRGSQIIGATVGLRGGTRLGTIQDFVLAEGGCVEYVVAGYNDQFIPIPWGAAMYQPGQRMLMVDIDPGRIHEMPMYHQISELTNRQFSDRVHTFYRGVGSQTGDMNHRGTTNQQGAAGHPQPATRGEQGRTTASPTQGAAGHTGRSERPGERR